MSCCDCSTTEGESELSTEQGTEKQPIIYLYKGAANILLLYIQANNKGTPLHWCRRTNKQSAPLHWCHDKIPCSGTALYTEQISTQLPDRDCPALTPSINQETHRKMHSMPYIAFA